MSLLGEEDKEFINHLKECGQHVLIVTIWLFALCWTIHLQESLFISIDEIVTVVILFEKLAIILTLAKHGSKMVKWFYVSIRNDIIECRKQSTPAD
ncbi:MAG TPA: hypothetical protein DCE78_07145 [Bacteroidetes bacterium]|nr:hypothetical protein [Bacteroidota bacterium]